MIDSPRAAVQVHEQAGEPESTEDHRMPACIWSPPGARISVYECRDEWPEQQMVQQRPDPQKLHDPLIRGRRKTVAPDQQ